MNPPFLPFLLLLMLASLAPATETLFYVGGSTKSAEGGGIHAGRIDTETGKLSPLVLAAPAKNPTFLALSPGGTFLYAASDANGGGVSAYRADGAGGLAFLNAQSSGGGPPCHVWVDATGHYALSAQYGGGNIAVYQTHPDGSLGERTAFVQFTGSSINPKRQTHSYAHSVYTAPGNRFVYACDLGADDVRIFRFDASHGTLTPTDPPSAKVPAGSGPRHLAFDRNGRFAYVCNEMGVSVTAFARDPETGALTPLQTVPTLPPGVSGAGVTAAEIVLHPSGKWLYVSNRAHDSIAVFAIGGDGTLSAVENAPAQVEIPWCIAIDPTGRWLIAAGRKSNRLAVLKIDPGTGKLAATGEQASVEKPMCILFAPEGFSQRPQPLNFTR